MIQRKQTEAHDWLADCAENYIAYLCAHAGFEVFGAGKWGADVVVHDKDGWWRIEVRSTDREKRPGNKAAQKLKGKAELLAEVKFSSGRIDVRIYQLTDGIKGARIENPAQKEFQDFIKEVKPITPTETPH